MSKYFTNSYNFKTISSKDNWGDPMINNNYPRSNPEYYDNNIKNICLKQYKQNENSMSKLFKTATAIHSINTEKYDNFESIDLIPENKDLYPRGSPWGEKYDFSTSKKNTILGSTCHIDEDEDGAQWEITRIGPFITTGGYDWIQIGWDDLWGLSKILENHPDGIYFVGQYMSPVLRDGTRLNYPPIHVHHIHNGPDPYVRQRGDPVGCLLKGKGCFNPIRTMEVHGDYVCIEEDGGNDCHIENFPDGYGKLITQTLGIEGELNDVRPTNSEPLEWFWEIGVKWVPKNTNSNKYSNIKPLSLQNYGGPGTYNPAVQRSYLITFDVPTTSESMFWYTGTMKTNGKLLRLKLHAHNSVFQESFFFAATPEELGLFDQHGFNRLLPHHALLPGEIGFENNEQVKEYIFDNLKKTQLKLKDAKIDEKFISKLVCHSLTQLEIIDGFAYDRRAPTSCDPWEWSKGQVFTVIGFNKWQGFPLGPYHPSLNDIPPTLAGHVGYWLSYDSLETPPKSNWGYSLHNQFPDGSIDNILKMEGYQKLAGRFNGYTSPHFHDWTKTPNSILGFVLFKAIQNFIMTLLIIFTIFCYGVFLLYKIWKKFYHERVLHKKNDELKFCDDTNISFSEKLSFIKELFLNFQQQQHQQQYYRNQNNENGVELPEEHTSLLSDRDEEKA